MWARRLSQNFGKHPIPPNSIAEAALKIGARAGRLLSPKQPFALPDSQRPVLRALRTQRIENPSSPLAEQETVGHLNLNQPELPLLADYCLMGR
jgi:hypothetical protein